MAACVACDGKQICAICHNLFIAILQCMLSKNIKYACEWIKVFFLQKLLIINSSNIYYRSAFFATFCHVKAKQCTEVLAVFAC